MRVKVADADLWSTVTVLRAIAAAHRVPGKVVVQPMLSFDSEAFIGVKARTDLGPMVVCGMGGIWIEVLNRVAGRLAPLGPREAADMIAELNKDGLLNGLRGGRPWDLQGLTAILLSVGRLATASADWLESLDLNPLVLTPAGFVAVDALFVAAPAARQAPRLAKADAA